MNDLMMNDELVNDVKVLNKLGEECFDSCAVDGAIEFLAAKWGVSVDDILEVAERIYFA